MQKIKVKRIHPLIGQKGGFVATFLVLSTMIMMMLGSIGSVSAAFAYSDTVLRRDYRETASLNAESCISVALLGFAHDYFYSAQNQYVQDFSCTIVSAVRNGSTILIQTAGSSEGVSEPAAATAQDSGRSIDVAQ